MKFSWKSLNQFIDLKQIDFNTLINKLPLIGFEVENIETNKDLNDKIIELSVTANRQDMLSTFGLARELSCILQQKLKNYTKYSQYGITTENNYINQIAKIQENLKIAYLRVNIINNIKNNNSTLWLQNSLENCNIQSSNLFNNIQNFIELKWGYKIIIKNISNIYKINKSIVIDKQYLKYGNKNLIDLSYDNNSLQNNSNSQINISTILICTYSNHYNDELINAYHETLYLIASLSKGSISKNYHYSKTKKINKYTLKVNKQLIQKTLGPTQKKLKYISLQKIFQILHQLKLNPTYNNYTKNFSITVPNHRKEDLYREIDIIEEIGRIYGYEKFIDQIQINNNKGNISKQYNLIKKIRTYFRNIGLHEVINSSLNHNYPEIDKYIKNQKSSVHLYNPLSEDQLTLRESLIKNILINHDYNIKQKNENIEIFEIGRIFKQKLDTQELTEEILLTGILNNKNFIKISWENKSSQLTWFHAKGILEEFFENLQIKIEWETINQNNTYLSNIEKNYFEGNKTAIIKEINTKNILGILGQIKPTIFNYSLKNSYIYCFEIKINQLIDLKQQQNHLIYNFSPYSIYPKVIRDISIRINKDKPIQHIKELIYMSNPNLIENIIIFNEYNDRKNNRRNIGLRIIYRSSYKTLNNQEIKKIDRELLEFSKTYQ